MKKDGTNVCISPSKILGLYYCDTISWFDPWRRRNSQPILVDFVAQYHGFVWGDCLLAQREIHRGNHRECVFSCWGPESIFFFYTSQDGQFQQVVLKCFKYTQPVGIEPIEPSISGLTESDMRIDREPSFLKKSKMFVEWNSDHPTSPTVVHRFGGSQQRPKHHQFSILAGVVLKRTDVMGDDISWWKYIETVLYCPSIFSYHFNTSSEMCVCIYVCIYIYIYVIASSKHQIPEYRLSGKKQTSEVLASFFPWKLPRVARQIPLDGQGEKPRWLLPAGSDPWFTMEKHWKSSLFPMENQESMGKPCGKLRRDGDFTWCFWSDHLPSTNESFSRGYVILLKSSLSNPKVVTESTALFPFVEGVGLSQKHLNFPIL